MARKPFKGSTIDNVLQHGVGALNIDATRIPLEEGAINPNEQGRFPSNVIGEVAGYQKFFYCPKVSRKERHTGFDTPPDPLANYSQGDVKNHPLWDPSIGTNVQRLKHKIMENNKDLGIPTEQSMLDDMGGYYIDNQGNKQEISGKDIYLPDYGYIKVHSLKDYYAKWCETNNKIVNVGNNHPTVKPVALMRYLIKLVTPPNSTVLDPFTGSGSTGMAAVELGHTFIGCELDPAYVEIAKKRIEAWNTIETDNNFKELFE
jgi:site-specific DNA-methyltransferase (adenine-specific)